MVLVLEFIGTIENFFNAVRAIPEMEYLAEFEEEFSPDDLFYVMVDEERTDRQLTGQLFLVMANQTALRELHRLWGLHRENHLPRTPSGSLKPPYGKLTELFKHLKDVRPYGVADRLRETNFEEYLHHQAEREAENATFEIELFFRDDARVRDTAADTVKELLRVSGARLLEGSEVVIQSIRYHAMVAEGPVRLFDQLSEDTNVQFLKCDQVMFFRPAGQVGLERGLTDRGPLESFTATQSEVEALNPVVALLDGLPQQNHPILRSRIIIDDPDDYARGYQVGERQHGTAMASMIVHGDLNDSSAVSLDRPIYVRPIMIPDPEDTFNTPRFESIPRNKLPADLVHVAVVRMFGNASVRGANVAADVKVINLSLGDLYRPFDGSMSPWARLLDHLSSEYQVLFVVSAGNYPSSFVLAVNSAGLGTLSAEEKQRHILSDMVRERDERRVLTPSESINSITVGATPIDSAPNNGMFDLGFPRGLLAPYSRIGFGHRRAIKPDVLMPGGKYPLVPNLATSSNDRTVLNPRASAYSASPPGMKVAAPGVASNRANVSYTYGTSNSSALATRLAARLHAVLEGINVSTPVPDRIDGRYYAVLIKALIAHGADLGSARHALDSILARDRRIPVNTRGEHITCFLGNGAVDEERVLHCTDQRVTLLGWGDLVRDGAHRYSLPLPDAFNTTQYHKRLIITLAWFSPINPLTNRYRKAQLYIDNLSPTNPSVRSSVPLNLQRESTSFRAGKRGTLQHDVLEGHNLETFLDGASLDIKVSCRQDAAGLRADQKVAYGLAVTIELLHEVNVPIYDQIAERISARVRVPASRARL